MWAVILIPNFLVWRVKRSDPIGDRSLTSGTDELQRGLVRPFIWFPAAVVLIAYPLTRISLHLIDGSLGETRYSAGGAVFGFLILAGCFGAALAGKGIYRKYRWVLNDELFLKNRTAGIQAGFLCRHHRHDRQLSGRSIRSRLGYRHLTGSLCGCRRHGRSELCFPRLESGIG